MARPFASAGKIICQGTCKPGSVHPLRGSATIPLGRRLPSASSDQPGRRAETGPCAAPIRSCTRWGLPCRARCRPRGALLPHPFDLTRPKAGGMLSVALSLTPPKTKPPGVTRHRCSVEPGLSSLPALGEYRGRPVPWRTCIWAIAAWATREPAASPCIRRQ